MLKYLRPYYVPVVAKNRDYLIGFYEMAKIASGLIGTDYTLLDSTKFNDLLPNGKRRREMEFEELKEYLKELDEQVEVLENPSEDQEDVKPFLEINCTCGNYHSFDVAESVPEQNLICEICGKVLIDYTGYDDSDFVYDGNIDLAFISAEEDGEDEDEE